MPRCEFCGAFIKKGGSNYNWHLNEHPVCLSKYNAKKRRRENEEKRPDGSGL